MFRIGIWVMTFYFFVSECSKVIDRYGESQRGFHLSNYCRKVGICDAGSHVMCLYYNPARVMGPSCQNFVRNISITPDYAQMILDITNKIRSKAANGLLKGQNGASLPKGYSIFKVIWDEELATLAQVWANQCILRVDPCRSTDKFPNVGQSSGMSRFTIKDWKPISKSDFNSTTLTPDKVKYSVANVMKVWYEQKDEVSVDQVKEFNSQSRKLVNNRFLQMVYGPITHIGCGISAYREYAYKDNNADMNYNSIQLVCNYSVHPVLGKPIYSTNPPTQPGYTTRCGCPLGYDEEESCLCYETGRKYPYSCKKNSQCKPSVVVLPIFTLEDAPPSRILINENATKLRDVTNEIFDQFDVFSNRMPIHNYYNALNNLQDADYKSDLTRRFPADVKKRYFDKKTKAVDVLNKTRNTYRVPGVPQIRRYIPRQSVFSKVKTFQLPIKKRNQITMNHVSSTIKKDVTPRKDFAKVKKLVSNYYNKNRIGKPFQIDSESDGYISHGTEILDNNNSKKGQLKHKEVQKTNTILAKPKYSNIYFNLTENSLNHTNMKVPSELGDNKLIYLLDKLEQEVNNIDLNTNEKDVFDEKIRKIYETLVNKLDLPVQEYKMLSTDLVNKTLNNDDKLKKIFNVDRLYNDEFEINKLKYMYRNLEDEPVKSDRSYINNSERTFTKKNYKNIIDDTTEQRRFRNTYGVRKNGKTDLENLYPRTEDDEYYPLESERRKYYHEKLKKLQNSINNIKRHDVLNDVHEDRHIRPVRPTKQESHQRHRRPRDHVNTFYMPDRARFLHGF